MPTISQLVRKGRRVIVDKSKSPALDNCPQRRGVCVRVLSSTAKNPTCVSYHVVRGTLDNAGVANRTQRRSKYGAKRPKAKK